MKMQELRVKAKEKGINSFGKSKEEIEALLGGNAPEVEDKPVIRREASDVEARAQEIRNTRREKGIDPLAPKYKLHTRGQKDGWHYRWPVATENRIYEMQQMGYQIDESADPVSAGDNAGGQKHVRMMIPLSIYKEDQARKAKQISETEKALTRADVKGGLQNNDGAYGDITIGQKTVKLGSTQG